MVPLAEHDIVTDLVTVWSSTPFEEYFFPTALAVALLPDLVQLDTDTFQDELLEVTEALAVVHLLEDPV